MKKILIVFGTRPEAIKMAPLVKKLKMENGELKIDNGKEKNNSQFSILNSQLKKDSQFETRVCVTAQHREMLDQVLELFEIKPDYDLNIMKPGQDLYDVTSSVLLGMKQVLEDFKPDVVFVHGDTTTTFSTSLAAFYKKIKVAHVEAGLRTGNIYSPWPEEANRQLTTQITTYHFAPTQTSKENLLKEGVPEENIAVTGNTVIDALFLALKKIDLNTDLKQQIINSIDEKIKHSTFNIQHSS